VIQKELDRVTKAPTVLVAEDDILLRILIADELRDAGFVVIEAGNADEVVSVLRSGTDVDVMISDILMPGSMDGVALARLVRLVLLRHIFLRKFRVKLRAHNGHRGSRAWAIA
jgi:CheY-like chemotaxis protein